MTSDVAILRSQAIKYLGSSEILICKKTFSQIIEHWVFRRRGSKYCPNDFSNKFNV